MQNNGEVNVKMELFESFNELQHNASFRNNTNSYIDQHEHFSLTSLSRNNTNTRVDRHEHYSLTSLIYLSIICPLITIGNLFIIIAVIRTKVLRKFPYILLASLATADLLVGMTTIPLFILWMNDTASFFNNDIFCKVVMSNSLFVTMATVFNLMFITTDRYLAVCWTIQHKVMTSFPHITTTCVSLIWILSLAFTIIITALLMDVPSGQCAYYTVFEPKVLLSMLIVGIVGPFLTMTAMYTHMFFTIRKHYIFMHQNSKMISQKDVKRKSQKILSTKRLLVTLTFVCIAFFIAWGPCLIVVCVQVTCKSCDLSTDVMNIVLQMGISNSLVNPIIYTYRNSNFRVLLQELYSCRTQEEYRQIMLRKLSYSRCM